MTETYLLEKAGAQSIADVAYPPGTRREIDGRVDRAAIAWLGTVQNGDGGFGKDAGSPGGPNWTALVILAVKGLL